jgi:hypothetical protein
MRAKTPSPKPGIETTTGVIRLLYLSISLAGYQMHVQGKQNAKISLDFSWFIA